MTKPTPRTDEMYLNVQLSEDDDAAFCAAHDLAKQLERELATANEKLARLRGLAKAVLEPWEPEWDTASRKELRAELGEE